MEQHQHKCRNLKVSSIGSPQSLGLLIWVYIHSILKWQPSIGSVNAASIKILGIGDVQVFADNSVLKIEK